MSAIAYWTIRQRLLRVPGVAQVNIFGERLQQRHVQVDPRKLAANGVSLERVMEVSADAFDAGVLQYTKSFLPGTGGFIEPGGHRLNIENVQPIVQPEDLGKVPVVERGGRVLRLSDVARVREDPA
jgi:multidrug efflux pump subunit AcrB